VFSFNNVTNLPAFFFNTVTSLQMFSFNNASRLQVFSNSSAYGLHSSWYGSNVLKSLHVGGNELLRWLPQRLQGSLNNVM
jgi:hypothetical protein